VRRGIAWSAGSLAAIEATIVAVKALVLVDTVGIAPADALGAGFAIGGALRVAAALLIAAAALGRATVAAAVLAVALVAAGTINNHAAGRLDHRPALMLMAAVHQLAAAAWIGGIPFFLAALSVRSDSDWLALARRFSNVCMAAVAALVIAGLAKSWFYIAEPAAIWGTAYGAMIASKMVLLGILLVLGAFNFIALRRDAAAARTRVRVSCRAEVELAIGLGAFFAAASATSLPPAVDLPHDRATLAEIAQRWAPQWPRLSSPSHAGLGIQLAQSRLEAHHAADVAAPRAYVPGAGEPPPRNAADIAWSEYNHHWAGLFVLAMGLLALIERSGRAPWARSWPLLFVGLAGFLLVRADPNAWPLGDIGFLESMRDADTLQHRVIVLLIAAFGLFEWAIRTGRIASRRAASFFPVAAITAGIVLLGHSHALANVKEELLTELTHLPIALLGVAAGAARWHELRCPQPDRWLPALVWPICFIAVGLILLNYREA
jgi:putative copper resistance protein D